MIQGSGSEAIIVVASVFLVISLLTVGLRCYVRLRVVHAFGWDDALMVFAMMLDIGFACLNIVGALSGMGGSDEFIMSAPEKHFSRGMLCFWVGEILYVVTCFVAKVSIAISLLRITVSKVHAWVLYGIITTSAIIALIFFFFIIFQCHPVPYFWSRLTIHGSCLNPNGLVGVVYFYSVVSAMTDFGIGVLPIFVIWNLQMQPRAKLALACILGIGCVAGAAVIVRIPFIQNFKSPNFLSISTQICIWSSVEAGLGITAGSLTTLRPLLRILRDGSVSGRSKGRTGRSYSYRLSKSNNRDRGYGHGHRASNRKGSGLDDPWAYNSSSANDEYLLTTTVIGGSSNRWDPSRSRSSASDEEATQDMKMDGLKVERSFQVSVTRD